MAEVGSAYVTLLPSLRGFARETQRQLGPETTRVGQQLGQRMGRSMSQSMVTSAEAGLRRGRMPGLLGYGQEMGRQVGQEMGRGVANAAVLEMGAGLRGQLGPNGQFQRQTVSQIEANGRASGQAYGQSLSNTAVLHASAGIRGQLGPNGQFQARTSELLGQAGSRAGARFGSSLTSGAVAGGSAIGGGLGSAMLSGINPSIVSISAAITGMIGLAKTAIETLDSQQRSAITYSAVLNIDDSDADAFVRKITKLDQLLPATAEDLNAVATRFSTFGKGADDVYKMTEAFAKAASATGSSSEEMVRAATQVGQSMSTGALRNIDWKVAMPSIAGLAPKFKAEVEKELGIPFEQALNDKVITPEVFSAAIQKVSASPQIAAGIDKMGDLFSTRWATAMGQFKLTLAGLAEQYKPQLLAITDALGAALQGTAHTFGLVLGVVARGVDVFTAVAKPVREWASHNRELVSSLRIAVGIFAGVTVAAWALSGGLTAARAGFVLLGNAVKANWVTLAVAALAAGIYLLWQRSETFRSVVTSTWDALRAGVTRAWAAVGPVFDRLREAFADVVSILTKGDYTGGLSRAFGIEEDSRLVDVLFRVRDGFLTVKDAITAGADTLRGKLAEVMDYLGPGLSFAADQFAGIWESFKGTLGGLWGLVKSIFVDAILPTFVKFGGYLRDSLWPTIQTVFANLSPVFELLGRVAVGAIAILIVGFRGLMAVVNTVVIPVFQWLWSNILAPVFGWVVDFAVGVALPALGGALEGVSAVLGFVATAALWLWDNALKPAFTWVAGYVTGTMAPALMTFWANVAQPVFLAVGTAATWLWNNVLQPAFQGLATFVVQVLAPALLWLWTNVVSPVFSWIGDKIAAGWNLVIKPALSALWAYITQTLVPTIQALWPVVQVVWDNFKSKVSTTWSSISTVFEALKTGVHAVKSTFETVTSAIGTVWESMKSKVETPVKFVVNSIVRDKLVAGWNAVAGKVGLPTWDFKGYAVGGWTGPGGKYQPAGIVHADEYVIRKESRGSIEREAPGLLDALNRYGAAALNRLAPGYADGGQVGKVQLFLQKLLSRSGGRYVLGAAHSPREWANPNQNVFDCCLAGSTPIMTMRGPVPIKDVEVGDHVVTWSESGPVTSVVARTIPQPVQPVFDVRTRTSSVTGSANHPFLVLRRGARARGEDGRYGQVPWWTEWVRLDELHVGDYVVHTDGFERPETGASLPGGVEVTEDVAWLLGQVLGDGHVNHGDIRIAAFRHVDRERIAQIVRDVFGVNAKEHPSHGMIICGRHVVEAFSMFSGLTSRTKAVPSLVWNLREKEARAFLAGYAAADGYVDPRDGTQRYDSVSMDLLVGVRALHQALGDVAANIRTTERVKPIVIKGKLVRDAAPLHSFVVSTSGKRKGQSLLVTKGARRAVPEGFTIERVRSITPQGEEPTYDLTVVGTSNYVADGMVVHNSGLQLWGMTQVGIPHKGGVAATLGRGNPQIGVSKAMSTPGAFLYRTSNPSAGTSGHMAASLGNGKTIEARGRAYGVGSWGAAGRFEGGSIHPGLSGSLSAAEQAALADAMASAGSGWSLPNAAAMVAHGLVNPFFEAAKALITGMVGTLGDTDAVKLAGGFGTKSVGMVQDFINKTIDRVFPALDFGGAATGGGDAGDDAPGGSVRDIVQQVAAARGWGSGPQWDALSWIIQKESGWNPKAQNPTSTAYGLFQLLNGTWAGTGYAKSSDPRIQALAGLAYIRNRYASPLGAKAFWQSHGWYADGGWVKPVLYDTGGILPPGVHLVENKTGKPETIRTFEQERTVQQRLTGGDTINVHVGQVRSPDDVDAIERVLRQRDIRNRARARVMAVA